MSTKIRQRAWVFRPHRIASHLSPYPCSLLAGPHQDCAEHVAAFHLPMDLGGIGERKLRIDNHSITAVPEALQAIAELFVAVSAELAQSLLAQHQPDLL